MSAYKDLKAPIQFYYGNAARDLGHLLPQEDEVAYAHEAAPASDLLEQLSRLEGLVDDMAHTQERLHFLMKDLKRIFS